MNELRVESSENGNSLVITGDIDLIFNNRRARLYLKEVLLKDSPNSTVTADSIIVDIGDGDISEIINRIKTICCKYISANLVISGRISKALYDYQLEEDKFKEFAKQAKDIRNNKCDEGDFKDFTESVEKNLPNRTLFELQLLSAYHLAFSQNACNFSVPGAGKTTVVYAAFAYLSSLSPENKKYVDKLLIVSPLSAFGPWELEYEGCFGRRIPIKRLSGKVPIEEKKRYLYSSKANQITLLSYGSVCSLKEEIIYFLQNNKVMVVLDEAHKIKGGGITALSALEIAPYCSARVVLTGTPAPNGYEDLYNLYEFIWPGKKIIPFKINQLMDMNRAKQDSRIDSLLNAVEPFFIRVKKTDLEIPEATEHKPIFVPMGEVQRRIYSVIEARYMKDIKKNKRDDMFRQRLVRARLVRMMQAATNPDLLKIPLRDFIGDEEFLADSITDDVSLISDVMKYAETPAKFIKARELIESIITRGGKVIVWTIYVQNIHAFERYLHSCGIHCKVLYGGTPVASGDEDEEGVETREKIIAEFHNPDSVFKVIVANPSAVAESISLHKACHNAIYLDRSFNAAHFIQSKDRIHRVGLEPNTETNYYYLLSQDSIDEVVHSRLIDKETRLRNIVESRPIPLFKIVELETGDDDIKALIADYERRTKKT